MSEHTHDWEIERQNVHGFLDVWCECAACGAVISADAMPAMLVELVALRAKLAAAEGVIEEANKMLTAARDANRDLTEATTSRCAAKAKTASLSNCGWTAAN